MTDGGGTTSAVRRSLAHYLVPVVVVFIDAITKEAALRVLFVPPGRVIEVLPFMNFVPVWNPGVSFGLLQNFGAYTPWILAVFALAVGLFLPWYARNWAGGARLGARLMAGGAIGNAIDRMAYGAVVDFFDLHAGGWHWPAFNVADIAITVGAGLILLETLGITFVRDSSRGDGH